MMMRKTAILTLLASFLFFIAAVGYWFYVHQRAYQNDLYLNEIATVGQKVRDYKRDTTNLPLGEGQLIPIASEEFREVFQTLEPKYCVDCTFYQQKGSFWIFGNIPYGKQCWGTKKNIGLPDGSFSETNFVLQGKRFNCWMGD